MIDGGNATVYVSDLERAIAFYTKTLGLRLRFRAGAHWAEVEAGPTLVIGLHPASSHAPRPGTPGSVQVGLTVDEPLEDVMRVLAKRGVAFEGPMMEDSKSGNRWAFFRDPDGNVMYLWEARTAARS